MSRIFLAWSGIVLMLAGCAGNPQPPSPPPTLAAGAAGNGYVRMTAEQRVPQTGVTLRPGDVVARVPLERDGQYAVISVFGRRTGVPADRVETVHWSPSHSYAPEFLSAVAEARRRLADELFCMRGRDLETMAALREIRTVQALMPIFREHGMQPAEYSGVEGRTAPEGTTNRLCPMM